MARMKQRRSALGGDPVGVAHVFTCGNLEDPAWLKKKSENNHRDCGDDNCGTV
jgi:hypothetical protein